MAADRETLLGLLRDPETPWAITLDSGNELMISAETWVTFACQRLGEDVDRATLEATTDDIVRELGGKRREVQGPGEFVGEAFKRLVGRGTPSAEIAYVIPTLALGQSPRNFAQQCKDAIDAGQTEDEQPPS